MVENFWEPIAELRNTRALDARRPRDFEPWAATVASAGFTPRDLAAAHELFLSDDDFARKRWPIAIFMREKVWSSRIRKLGPAPPPASPLRLELHRRLQPLHDDGHSYAAQQLAELEPVELVGTRLRLRPADPYFAGWCADHYGSFLERLQLELTPPLEAR